MRALTWFWLGAVHLCRPAPGVHRVMWSRSGMPQCWQPPGVGWVVMVVSGQRADGAGWGPAGRSWARRPAGQQVGSGGGHVRTPREELLQTLLLVGVLAALAADVAGLVDVDGHVAVRADLAVGAP